MTSPRGFGDDALLGYINIVCVIRSIVSAIILFLRNEPLGKEYFQMSPRSVADCIDLSSSKSYT
jgi:hypothetical protein